MFGEVKGGSGCAKPKSTLLKKKSMWLGNSISGTKKKISSFYWGVYVTSGTKVESPFFPINFITLTEVAIIPSFLDGDA